MEHLRGDLRDERGSVENQEGPVVETKEGQRDHDKETPRAGLSANPQGDSRFVHLQPDRRRRAE